MKAVWRTLFWGSAALALVEVGSRIALGTVYDRSFESRLIEAGRYGRTDGLVPDASGKVWRYPFTVDGDGGRSTHAPADTAKGHWLYLGDSVGEGVGVEDTACAVSIVARRAPSHRVVNLCHIGHSTCDQLAVLQRWADTCNTLERVTVLHTLNDVYGWSGTDELPPMRHPGILSAVREWAQENVAIYRLLKLLVMQGSDRYFRYDRAFYTLQDPHWRAMLECLDGLKAACEHHGIALDLVLLPYRSQVDGGSDAVPQEMLQRACKERGIDLIDALPAFKQEGDAAALYLFADEIHLSAAGHRALARVLERR